MRNVLVWGLDIVKSVQSVASPELTAVMRAVTLLGSSTFFLLALPFVYWCVDRRKGTRLGVVILLSAWLNLFIKNLFMQPRPYDMDQSVMMDREITPGLPSGHSMGTVSFWGAVAALFRRPLWTMTAVVIPLAVGFSRVYLGVHFPTDVFAGWAAGFAVVILFMTAGERVATLIRSLDRRFKIVVVAAIALAMNQFLKNDMMLGGLFLGSGVGFVITSETLRFSAKGSPGLKALRYAVGMASTAIVYLGPKLLIGDALPRQENLIRFMRYGIVGAWISLGAPWLFLRLNLVGLEEPRSGTESAVHSESV